MNIHPWAICITGIVFCISGIYFFFKNIFEEGRTIGWSVVIMLMGILLITIATSKLLDTRFNTG
jgi:hypothetical protein